ncbi:hypothetical protein [Tomitella biformata]|uniref:hypothetical protein n=1 Tax=Tomitella biformata TaxID=630403 RepID=UPI000464975F|nr:hypothetical protein [Tomitella biformata]
MPQRYGDLATWTGSIGTVAAFGIGFLQIHKERRHRLARELEDRHRARREHVDRVTAWFTGGELIVANGSGHPIHDVDIIYHSAPPGPSPTAEPVTETLQAPFVVPGETRLPAAHGDSAQIPTVLFTDVRGDRWRREPGKPATRLDTQAVPGVQR